MVNYIKDRLNEPSTYKGLISVGASIVMAFTPDHVDAIIQGALVLLGGADILTKENK